MSKCKKFLADRLFQYGIISGIVGLSNFFMIFGLYFNQIFNFNPFIITLFAVPVVFITAWCLKKVGFISEYLKSSHTESPVLTEILKNTKKIIERMDKDE